MTKKSAVGASFKTAKEPLTFEVPDVGNPVRGGMTRITLSVTGSDVARIRSECDLDGASKLVVVVGLSCSSFRVRRELWSHEFRADDVSWTKDPVIVEVPSDMIRAGCVLEVQVVVVDSVPECGSRLACSVRGGIVARGSHEFEPKNGGGLFPIRSVREPSLWSFRSSVGDPDDLDKAVGAAFRLDVDSEHFGDLLDPVRASEEVRKRTENLLLVEALTAAVISVLGNEELVQEFDGLLQMSEPPEKTMNTRTARFFLLGLLRRLPDPLPLMRTQLLDEPVKSGAQIREVMADLVARIV